MISDTGVPRIAPQVDKEGLDLFMWCDNEAVYVEAVSANAKDHLVDMGADKDSESWVFGIDMPLEVYLHAIPAHFTYGLLQDDGEVARITPTPLH